MFELSGSDTPSKDSGDQTIIKESDAEKRNANSVTIKITTVLGTLINISKGWPNQLSS